MLARRQLLQFVAGVPLLALQSERASAQAYPTRPVRVIVTTGPGGQGDTTARLVAAKLSESLGQSFYIENMPGGGGNIAMAATPCATPDGYTILAATSNIVTNISLYPKISYDPYKDFEPISLMCSSPHVLVIHPSIPARSVNELVALAKASPGKYSYASAGRGTPAHLAGELFKLTFGVDITHVPFNGGHRLHARRPRSDRGLGRADGGDLYPGRPIARAGNVQQQTFVRVTGCSHHAGSGGSRSSRRHRDWLRCAGRNAATDRRIPSPRNGEGPVDAGHAGQACDHGLRSGSQHAGGIRAVDQDRDRALGQGHPRRASLLSLRLGASGAARADEWHFGVAPCANHRANCSGAAASFRRPFAKTDCAAAPRPR